MNESVPAVCKLCEAPGIVSFIALVIVAVVVTAIVILAVRGVMRKLLSSNSTIAPAGPFYVRTFAVVLCLAVLAAIAGKAELPGDDDSCIECVWWIVDGLETILWSAGLFLAGYVVLLTILYAVLGRYRDK